ncbi:MAG: proline--tRNA ligase [Anaerolineales bacterium]|nr:proline--tRNA ligase [Anaerolineales bacterium]
MSHQFGQTLREAPAEAEVVSHQLLVRAGFIRQLGAGIFSYLGLARRSLTKIENIMREEINAIGGQEVTMPVVHPADIWKETGRWHQIGTEMGRLKDKSGRDMALAMTHEEVVADLTRREVQSYRQLPMLVYHIQTKWRDDPRPRAGLIRVREFTMLDSYSLDADEASLDRQYRAHYQAYFNIFNRCALPTITVKSDVGMMGGSLAHEFMYLTPIGEDTLLLCDHCGYAANRQIARFRKPATAAEAPQPLERVATPGVATIEALAEFLGVPKARTAKAVFLIASVPQGDSAVDRFVLALVRGDMEVNETKLANAVKAKELRPAREEEIRAVGAVPGYASPVGLDPRRVLVVVDEAIPTSPNLVGGANEPGYHTRGVNYGRDFTAAIVADIAAAGEGDACPVCGHALRVSRGVEVGNIFKLGTRYTDAMGATFLDRGGSQRAVIMGSYGIGSGRLLACVAEAHHDADGLAWPITVAPYQVHLVLLPDAAGQAQREAEALYARLQAAGVEVLFDDRDERPGVKFKDADLIGLPLRVTVSERSLKQGGVELKRRTAPDRAIVPLGQAVSRLQAEITALYDAIASGVGPVPYPEAP